MSLTVVSATTPVAHGHRKEVDAVVALDGSYPMGGYKLLPIKFNLSEITKIREAMGEGWILRHDPTFRSLRVYGASDTGDMTEVVVGTDLSGVDSAQLEVIGW